MTSAGPELIGTYLDSMLTSLTRFEEGKGQEGTCGHTDYWARSDLLRISKKRGMELVDKSIRTDPDLQEPMAKK